MKIQNTILPKLISGRIYSIENQENEILMLMDTMSGIDYIRRDDYGLQGVAARVQFGPVAYNSFTIRYKRHSGSKTEYEKRTEAIKNGYFYPEFTLQAYFDSRKALNLKTIAIIKTLDLYNFCEKHPDKTVRRKSDNDFIAVFWGALIDNGVLVKAYPKEKMAA